MRTCNADMHSVTFVSDKNYVIAVQLCTTESSSVIGTTPVQAETPGRSLGSFFFFKILLPRHSPFLAITSVGFAQLKALHDKCCKLSKAGLGVDALVRVLEL